MGWAADPEVLAWLSSPDNPPVRKPSARDLAEPRPAGPALEKLRTAGGWRTTSDSTTGTGGPAATG